jgi:hypothetical protein
MQRKAQPPDEAPLAAPNVDVASFEYRGRLIHASVLPRVCAAQLSPRAAEMQGPAYQYF